MAVKAQIVFLENTGIGNGNYPWANSKKALDDWFMGYSTGEIFTEYSVVRGDSQSKNGYNVACVHVNKAYEDAILCDYIGYKNDGDNRQHWAAVVGREFVNTGSTRIYFAIDYVASYFDLIDFGYSFVDRMTDESEPYENLLPEPIGSVIFEQPINGAMGDVNAKMGQCSAVVVSQADLESGNFEINEPQGGYLSGSWIGGYIYRNQTKDQVKEKIKSYYKTNNSLFARQLSAMNAIRDIIVSPNVAQNDSQQAERFSASIPLPQKGLWNKTKNYQWAILVGNSGSIELRGEVYSATVSCAVFYYGGANGFCRVIPQIKGSNFTSSPMIDSAAWAGMPFAGSFVMENAVFNGQSLVAQAANSLVKSAAGVPQDQDLLRKNPLSRNGDSGALVKGAYGAYDFVKGLF